MSVKQMVPYLEPHLWTGSFRSDWSGRG